MSNNTNSTATVIASATASEATVEGLASITEREAKLKELKKAVREKKDRQAWEEKIKARNPQYVMGSLRSATSEDEASLTHCHGQVADIECTVCGKVRVVNKQDAFQVRFCEDHKAEARKLKAKAKRAEKRLEGKSVADINAEIERLTAELDELDGEVETTDEA